MVMEFQLDYRLLYNHMLKVIAIIALTMPSVLGQTLKNQNIGTLGSSVSMQKGYTFRSVVGQPSSINLMVVDKTPVSQGFIHPKGNSRVGEKNSRNMNMSVFPNPSSRVFQIEAEFKSGDRIEVRNILGLLVFSEQINSSVQTKSIDIGFCAEGLYSLSIFGETEHLQTKLIELIK